MLDIMPKRKSKPAKSAKPKARPPSRENYKYLYLPKDLWEALERIGTPQERSVSYMVKKAVQEFLERHGSKDQQPT